MCVDSVSHNIDNSVWGLALITACSQPAASSGFTRCQCLKSCTLSACLCPWSGCCMMFAWSSSEVTGYNGCRMAAPANALATSFPSRTAPISSPPEGRQRASCSRWEGLNRTIAGNLNHDPPVLLVFRELAVQLRDVHSVSVTDGRSQCGSLSLDWDSGGSWSWWGSSLQATGLLSLQPGEVTCKCYVKIKKTQNKTELLHY